MQFVKFQLFADDTNLYFSSKSLSLLESTLNPELKYIAERMKVTNFILFHSCKLKPSQSFSVKIDDAIIKKLDSAKYLGITFDSNLKINGKHISELYLKLSKTVGVLSKVRNFVDSDILLMLYCSLIFPFLTYRVHVWGLTFPSF